MLRFVLLLGVCAAWKHFASFNADCDAELSFLRGTQMEATVSVGRLGFQFKNSLQNVLWARIKAEGCVPGADQATFWGMEILNVLRFLDSSDTTLTNAKFPAGCDPNVFAFNWQKMKADFPGIVLPSSCTAANFAVNKKCQIKFKMLENFYVELAITDTCPEYKNGYGLPSIALTCSGDLCASLGKPCTTAADCSGGAGCDAVGFNTTDWNKILSDLQLFSNSSDYDACNVGGSGFDFGERFYSTIINTAASMFGLTTGVATTNYHEVKLCGASSFQQKFVPSQAPTPVAAFRCPSNSAILTESQVCNGVSECPNGEDEAHCSNGCGYTDNAGRLLIDDGPNIGWCCPICPGPNDKFDHNGATYYCNSQFCANPPVQSVGVSICQSTGSSGPLDCPDFFMASTNSDPLPAAKPTFFATTDVPNEHIMGWADCDGNAQFGNPNEIGVANFQHPFQNIAKQLESILTTFEKCRFGTQPTSWARYFFPWSINLWGGVFFTDEQAGNIFGNVNPGKAIDDSARYYGSSERVCMSYSDGAYNCTGPNPPFANVANPPDSCNIATTTGSGTCELQLDISSWFKGGLFPTGWDQGQTLLRFKAASSCSSSALPQMFVTCEGPCDASKKSGCCILKDAFLAETVPGVCPKGYKSTLLDTEFTDFLFNGTSTKSKDTTLINFLNLLTTKNYKFGGGFAPFSSPAGLDPARSICIIDGEAFGSNQDVWANSSVTEECPIRKDATTPGNHSQGCPQFIPGSAISGCGSSCLQPPKAQQCDASGCPTTPLTDSPATVASPALVVAAGLIALLC